jgi:hypothetical protein
MRQDARNKEERGSCVRLRESRDLRPFMSILTVTDGLMD